MKTHALQVQGICLCSGDELKRGGRNLTIKRGRKYFTFCEKGHRFGGKKRSPLKEDGAVITRIKGGGRSWL